MILYLDSSALVKYYTLEVGRNEVEQVIHAAELAGASLICRAEVSAALAKAVRMQALAPALARESLLALHKHWPNLVRLAVTEEVVTRAEELAWSHGLRGYDAVHLASALVWQDALQEPVCLATFDRALWLAASSCDLQALPEGLCSPPGERLAGR